MDPQNTTVVARVSAQPINQGLIIDSLEKLQSLASFLFLKGGLRPAWASRPEEIATVILAGQALGIPPIQAINGIMIMGGRAVIWGDLALALVRRSTLLDEISEKIEGSGDQRAAVCTVKRRGVPNPTVSKYSMADARQAGLLDEIRHKKKGPWWTNPDRQLTFRARGFALRDLFGDVLNGLDFVEAAQDEERMTIAETVTITSAAPTNAPAALPTPTTAESATPPAAGDQPTHKLSALNRISLARGGWYRSKGIDPADKGAQKREWLALLQEKFGVESATLLSDDQAAHLAAYLESESWEQEKREVFQVG